jgi:two-component system, OmpR family, phosphate regulon sensor histidine kinase PhoR
VRKIRINFIILLVIIALFSLLIIQFFQTAQLYDRKSSQFKSSVQTLVERIAIHHEKAEDIRKYLQVFNKDFSGQYKDILKKEFQTLLAAKGTIHIKDTTILDQGELKKYLLIQGKSFDSLSGLTTEQKVMARDLRQLRQLFNKDAGIIPNKDSSKVSIQLDQRVMEQIFKKAKYINEIMVEAFRDNIYDEPHKRIDIEFLDSVIAHEIKFSKLPEDYQFLLTDGNNKPIHFKFPVKKYNKKLDTANLANTFLFPQNILDEKINFYLKFNKESQFVFKEMGSMMSVNIGLMLLIIVAIFFMFKTIITQKKLSEMKNDFISNMTHEFKTPISTISLACQALNDKDMVSDRTESISPFVKMIADENKRLEVLVERILQSAVIDRHELKLRKEKINLNQLLNDICNATQLKIASLEGVLKLDLPNQPIEIEGDRFHTTNIISNLIDNAIKYSKKNPVVNLTLKKEGKKTYICVTDKGIGISKEYLNRIFDKLYRIPTGNIHNVKGFGLGLSYVKAIVEISKWNITVKSKINEGSTFTIIIPE